MYLYINIYIVVSISCTGAFFYRDLKMENILLDKKKRNLKIIGGSTSQNKS